MRQCAICQCTDTDPCIGGCAWVEDPSGAAHVIGSDVCTACFELAATIGERLERIAPPGTPGALEAYGRHSLTEGLGGLFTLSQLALHEQQTSQFEKWTPLELPRRGAPSIRGYHLRLSRRGLPGTTVTLKSTQTTQDLRIDRMALKGPEGAALSGLYCGGRSQLVSATPIPLAVFSAELGGHSDFGVMVEPLRQGARLELVIELHEHGGPCRADVVFMARPGDFFDQAGAGDDAIGAAIEDLAEARARRERNGHDA